jgi:hypothetical protein
MVGETKPEHPLPHRRPPFNHRQLLTQVVVAGVILVSGIGIGTGGTILVLKDRIVWDFPSPPPDRPPGPRPGGDIVERLKVQYSLTDEQVQQVKDVFAKRLEAARARWKQLSEIEQAEREKLVQDMKGILTPEQFEPWRADFTKMMKEVERRPFWGPRGDHRGPPRGERGPGRSMDPDGRRGGRSPDRFMGPDGRRMDGPPRPPMDPDSRHRGDRPPDQPAELNGRSADVNAPK